MSTWTDDELQTLARTNEIRVAGRRDDGSLRPLVIIWHVVVDGALYARSVYGTEGKWYQGVARHWEGAISWDGQTRDVRCTLDSSHDDAIDAAYFAKYGRGAPSQHITSAAAKETTLRIEPAPRNLRRPAAEAETQGQERRAPPTGTPHSSGRTAIFTAPQPLAGSHSG